MTGYLRYQPGDVIGGRYEVTQVTSSTLLDRYECLDRLSNLRWTLGAPRSSHPVDPKSRTGFFNSVAIWLSLGVHPNILRCHRLEMIDRQPFLILESIGGIEGALDLRSHLRHGPLKLRQALEYSVQICRALRHGERQQPGFVHRNLSAESVLLASQESIKLGGFELATMTSTTESEAIESDSGVFQPDQTGIPAYMAPEQWRGESLDLRADLYALGCLLYEMLIGATPYTGSTDDLRRHHLEAPVPQPGELSAPLNEILRRCLAKSPAERFEDSDALRKALTDFYRKQFDKKPKPTPDFSSLSAADYLVRGASFNLMERYELALIDLERSIAFHAEPGQAHTQRAIANFGLKRYREALADAKTVLQANPDDGQANIIAGRALLNRGEAQAALPYLDRAARLGAHEAEDALKSAQIQLAERKTKALQMSTAVRVSRQQATAEAARSHHESVQPEHLFNGLTKLEDMLTDQAQAKLSLPASVVPDFQAEVNSLIDLFKQFGLTPRQVRRAMRLLLGDGGHRPPQGDPEKPEQLSRSPESRAVLDRAGQLAQDAGSPVVAVQHLLAALLDAENTRIGELLRGLGADVEALYAAAASLPLTGPSVTSTPTLDEWGIDLTALARQGKIHEAIGRREEMLQVIRTLARESKNNPVLVGDAGVGKTAIVEGIAHLIATRNIDPNFHHKRIIQINVGDIVAGTSYRGTFEERMKGIVNEASAAPDVILFIDEIHMLVGAGLVEDSNIDAANILKPALARGQIKLIGATTEAEYYRYIAKDAAFERRFQLIRVEEPSSEQTRTILLAIRERLQKHHAVTIQDDAVDAAIQLSVRYLPNRRLPDKARDLLDEACARVRYAGIGVQPGTDESVSPEKVATLAVTVETIREVVAEKARVPVARMTEEESQRILKMADFLRQRVVGQERAIESVANAIRRNYADLRSDKRPVGVFLFVGPSGVGKTELAKATANFLFGADDRIIRLDMSEYMEAHSVSRLVGAPPGYVGFEQGGQLTEALRRTPYSVVLLDEVEKAHPDVMNVFLQAFGEGRLTDGQGRTVDARNAIFMMTSNLGSQGGEKERGLGFGEAAKPKRGRAQKIDSAVRAYFRPELLNRLDEVVIFQPLSQDQMVAVARVHLKPLQDSLAQRGVSLKVSDEAVQWLAAHGYDEQFGARPLIRLIDKQIANEIGGLLLAGRIAPGATASVGVEADELRIAIELPPAQPLP